MISFDEYLQKEYGFEFFRDKSEQLSSYNPLQELVARVNYGVAISNSDFVGDFEEYYAKVYAKGNDFHRDGHLNLSEAFSEYFSDLIRGNRESQLSSSRIDWNQQANDCRHLLGIRLNRCPTDSEFFDELKGRNILGQVMFDRVRDMIRENNPEDREGNYELPGVRYT